MRKLVQFIIFYFMSQDLVYGQVCQPTPTYASNNIELRKISIGSSFTHWADTTVKKLKYLNQFDDLICCLTQNSSNPLILQLSYCGYDQAVGVWVDWDKNDSLDSSEIIFTRKQIAPGDTASHNFSIPAGQKAGKYRMRVMVDYYYYYFNANKAFDPCQSDYGNVTDFSISIADSGLDLSAFQIPKPNSLAIGNNTIDFSFVNLASTTIDSFRAGYQITGGQVFEESVTLNSKGQAMQLKTCEVDTHTFSQQITIANQGSYQLKAWVSYSNGSQPDSNPTNDTVVFQKCTGLSGTYTIDQTKATSGQNFQSFHEAAEVLNTCGVYGPVKFLIAVGTYTDSISLISIDGLTATNTLSFEGVDSAKCILQAYNAVIVYLYNVSHISFKNITFKMLVGGNSSKIINIEAKSDYVSIDSCNFNSTNIIANAILSYSSKISSGNYLKIRNCSFRNTYLGIYINGSSAGNTYGHRIEFCRFDGHWLTTYFYGCDSIVFKNNEVTKYGDVRSSLGNYQKFINNNISVQQGGTGLYLYKIENSEVYNNTISQEYNNNGLLNVLESRKIKIYHNSFLFSDSTSTGSICRVKNSQDIDFRNNLLQSKSRNSNLLETDSSNQFSFCDYNNYYNGSNSTLMVRIGKQFQDLNSLKGHQGMNEHSTNKYIPFVNDTLFPMDLHLQNKFVPHGINLGITKDIDGNNRCVKSPTMGAVESNFALSPVVSDFELPDTGYTNSPLFIQNKSKTTDGRWFEWLIDTVSSVAYTSEHVSHTFAIAGTYTVKLRTFTCWGQSDAIKSIIIVNQNQAPVAVFEALHRYIEPGEFVALLDKSKQGPTGWEWTVTGINAVKGVDFDFIGGTDSNSQNPRIKFYKSGTYSICLKAFNAVGANTACYQNYVKVLAMENICNNSISTDSMGLFFDNGARSGKVWNSVGICEFTIAPCQGPVLLKFEFMDIDTNKCYLWIFDGSNYNGKLLNASKAINSGDSFRAISGTMFIVWEMKSLGNNSQNSGWEARWRCERTKSNSPSAKIKSDDTGFVNLSFEYEPANFNKGTVYDWDFDNDGTLDFQGRYGSWTYTQPGNYTCMCVATTCSSVDTQYRQIVVVNNSSLKPSPVSMWMDIGGGLMCEKNVYQSYVIFKNQSVYLYDKSGNGPTRWKWEISSTHGGNYYWGNSDTTQNAEVTFTDTGYYSIKLIVSNTNGTDSIAYTDIVHVINNYCWPQPFWPDGNIVEFSFGTISNQTAGYPGYSNYSNSLSTCVEVGKEYHFQVKQRDKGYSSSIWIDFNQDGEFSDSSELVNNCSMWLHYYWSGYIKIPAKSTGIKTGRTILRVANTSYSPIDPCTNDDGEYEDYSIIIIPNKEPPVITLIGKDTLYSEIGRSFTDPLANAYDSIDGKVGVVVTGMLDIMKEGYYLLRYDAKDLDGNEGIPVYRVVKITPDTTPPLLKLVHSTFAFHEVNLPYIDSGVTVFDLVDGYITNYTYSSNIDTTKLGQYFAKYIATDKSGNMDSAIRTVIVRDTTRPVVTLIGNDTEYVEVNGVYTEKGATAIDNYTQNLTVSIVGGIGGNVNTSVFGTTKFQYYAADSMGNTGRAYRYVIVRKTSKPIITLIGKEYDSIPRWSVWTDPGVTAQDSFFPAAMILSLTTITGTVDTQNEGDYVISYQGADNLGNKSNLLKRYVTVTPYIGITNTSAKPILVYPNPANSMVTLEGLPGGISSIRLIDAMGRLIFETVANESIVKIDIGQISNGFYTIQISGNTHLEFVPLMIVH